MKTQLKQDLKNYFEAIKEPNLFEQNMLKQLQTECQYVDIPYMCISEEDTENIDMELLTLESIAEQMGEMYQNEFTQTLRIAANDAIMFLLQRKCYNKSSAEIEQMMPTEKPRVIFQAIRCAISRLISDLSDENNHRVEIDVVLEDGSYNGGLSTLQMPHAIAIEEDVSSGEISVFVEFYESGMIDLDSIEIPTQIKILKYLENYG